MLRSGAWVGWGPGQGQGNKVWGWGKRWGVKLAFAASSCTCLSLAFLFNARSSLSRRAFCLAGTSTASKSSPSDGLPVSSSLVEDALSLSDELTSTAVSCEAPPPPADETWLNYSVTSWVG